MLCMAYELMRRCEAKLREDATDKDARCSWGAYAGLFSSMGAKFGLTPSDRARLGEDKPERDSDDELEEMLK
jgi:phage terminase small subunit